MEARIGDVIKAASRICDVPIAAMLGKRRFTEHVRARQLVHYVAKEIGHSYPRIGLRMGGFDHTTVIHGHRKMAALVASNEEMANMVQATRELARKINAGVAPMVEASLIEKAPQPAPAETKPARPMISIKQATIQEANDAAMERRCRLTRWGEEFGQQYVNQRGVYAHPGTADGEEKLLAALRREHPDKEIDLKEAKEYGAAAVVVDKVPH